MVGYGLAASSGKPGWLDALLTAKFFAACAKHAALKKNEQNIFCVDCCVGICQHCLSGHSPHRLLQIRRYVYHDVIRLQDILKLIDCALVQTYIINSAKVVFLNQRPQSRPSKVLGNTCETCERSLQDAFRYCSVACKVDVAFKHGKDLQNLIPRCNSLHISDLAVHFPGERLKAGDLESDEQLSPISTLEGISSPTSSGSTTNDGVTWGSVSCTAATTKSRLKRIYTPKLAKENAAISPRSVIPLSFNRRKGTPYRSPFC